MEISPLSGRSVSEGEEALQGVGGAHCNGTASPMRT